MIHFKKIDKDNYMQCIDLKVMSHQTHFVASNAQSLLDSFYMEGLYTLGIYNDEQMVGFLLYDYDEEIPGWSLSRFMIGDIYQGQGFGKAALKAFMEYYIINVGRHPLYACINVENSYTQKMFEQYGFKEIKEIGYTFMGFDYLEKQYLYL